MEITRINSDCSLIEFAIEGRFYHVHVNPESYWGKLDISHIFEGPLHPSTAHDPSWAVTSQELKEALESYKNKFIKNFSSISEDIEERYGAPAWEPQFCIGALFPDAQARIDSFL